MKIKKTASGKYIFTKQAWISIGQEAGWIREDNTSKAHSIYDEETIDAMREVQLFIKENGIEVFRDLVRQIRRKPTSPFVDIPQKGLSGLTGPA